MTMPTEVLVADVVLAGDVVALLGLEVNVTVLGLVVLGFC